MKRISKHQYKIVFFIALSGVLLLALLPNQGGVDTHLSDKANHFIAFFTLSLLLNRASTKLHVRIRNALLLLGFGILIELLQAFLPYRESSILDIVADMVGIVAFQIFFGLYLLYKKRPVKLS